ncbi:MAG: response regulator transcription factor [Actinobacteria bacterium]|nr:response regulator transcription factor [Actinomycetota bacterium]
MNDPRCLLADDHPALTVAISAYLSENGFEVVGPVPDGRRAVLLAAECRPELALIDYRMPRMSGVDLIHAIHEVSPVTKIAVYTAEADEQLATEVLAAGAVALVLKEAPLADLVRALESALAGGSYLDPALARDDAPNRKLTQRELDVLGLLAEGLPHEEIGRRLGISSETVRTHLRKASDRLGAATRTQAVATALRLGLIA